MPPLGMGRTCVRLGRVKGGQSAWSPNRGPSAPVGGSMPSILSGKEALRLGFRPLPREYTVDYEEDYGDCVVVQREFVSPRGRDANVSTSIHGLGFSDVELKSMKKQLASHMNHERNDRHRASSPNNAVQFQVNAADESPEGATSRFIFDEPRLRYIERFERLFSKDLRPLAEACAVLHGVDDLQAREGWYSEFLALDATSIDAEKEQALAVLADAEDLEQEMCHDPEEEGEGEGEGTAHSEAASRGFVLPMEYVDFAPLYRNFAAYCKGKAPVATPRLLRDHGGRSERAHTKMLWRQLMDKLVEERYENVTEEERVEAANLCRELHTRRLIPAKINDMVMQQAARARAIDAVPSVSAVEVNAAHPEQREQLTEPSHHHPLGRR